MKEIILTKKEIFGNFARLTFSTQGLNDYDYKIQFPYNKEFRNYNIVVINQNEFQILVKQLKDFSKKLIESNIEEKFNVKFNPFPEDSIDKIKSYASKKDSSLLLIASDTGITHILSLIRQDWFNPYLKMTKIIWFYQEDFIQPEFLIQEFSFLEQTNFYYHKIPINDEFERMEFSRQIIEKEIEKHKISYVLITGDGKINHALETTLIVHEIPENIIETIAYYNPNPLKRDPPENGILRTGFTTGACAAASAKAATKAILEKKFLKKFNAHCPIEWKWFFH
jgi:hypothetical protein